MSAKAALDGGRYSVTVQFAGGSAPFTMKSTKNCTSCCGGSAPAGKISDGHTLDFDVCSASASECVNATGAVLNAKTGTCTNPY